MLASCSQKSEKPSDKPPETPAAKSDQDLLNGTWEIVASEINGKRDEMPAELRGKFHWVFTGDKIRATDAEGGYEATWSIDASKNPKTFDMTIISGSDKGSATLGLYELDGDNLKLCYGENRPAGKIRPTEIRSTKDYGIAYFKRAPAR